MARKRKGRNINGIVLLDKALGGSSNHVLQQVRRLYGAAKAGHTGALDPLASGMLPVCLGEATKFSQFLLDADKQYDVTAKLGIRTTTSDADGEVVSTAEVTSTQAEIRAAIEQFVGNIQQVPSMYSALKHQGKPLYHYARQGIEIERPARDICIYSITIHDITSDEVTMSVHCSKGTYIRSLVDDIGQVLGCGAYVTRLHRTHVADYPNDRMMTIEALQSLLPEDNGSEASDHEKYQALDAKLLPMDTAVASLPSVNISAEARTKFCCGNPVPAVMSENGLVRVYEDTCFLGVADFIDGQVHPKRVVVYSD